MIKKGVPLGGGTETDSAETSSIIKTQDLSFSREPKTRRHCEICGHGPIITHCQFCGKGLCIECYGSLAIPRRCCGKEPEQ